MILLNLKIKGHIHTLSFLDLNQFIIYREVYLMKKEKIKTKTITIKNTKVIKANMKNLYLMMTTLVEIIKKSIKEDLLIQEVILITARKLIQNILEKILQ